MSNCLT